LGLYDFDMLAKSPNAYPSFGPAAASAMAGEIHELTEHVMDELDGSVTSLLSATDWQVPQALAAVYGLSGPGLASDGLSPRAGALTTSAFLAMHAYEDNSSVIRRGVFIRRAVLCGDLPPPQITDDQRDSVLGPAAEANTARERLAPLTQSGQCASCHEAINPIGLGLENFDAVGQWRDTENGAVIDPAGEIDGAGDANGSFDDPLGLVDLIANSLTVQQCYSQKLVRFALGRLIGPEDSCTVDDLKYVAQESGGDIREMLVGMTLTHSFRFRRSSQ